MQGNDTNYPGMEGQKMEIIEQAAALYDRFKTVKSYPVFMAMVTNLIRKYGYTRVMITFEKLWED